MTPIEIIKKFPCKRTTDPYYYEGTLKALEIALELNSKLFYETGVVTKGEGMSTFIWLEAAKLTEGEVHSVDIVDRKLLPQELFSYDNFYYHQHPSNIPAINKKVDFFYLDAGKRDGIDALLEVEMVEKLSHVNTVLLIDDWDAECRFINYHGKGRLSVPQYILNGWKPVYRGYQILLRK